MAMTADGKIATTNRALSHFGSKTDSDNLFALRATADAICCGAGTVNSEDPDLGPGPKRCRQQRLRSGLAEYPLRVVISATGNINPSARLFDSTTPPLLILTSKDIPRCRLNRLIRKSHTVRAFGKREVHLTRALRWLHDEWNVRRLLLEGGGQLNDAFLRADLVDELHLTICPLVAGGRYAPTIADGIGFGRLAHAHRFTLQSHRRVGAELFLVYSRR